jgi:hypothetical protein
MTGHHTPPFALGASQTVGVLGAVLSVACVAWSAARVAADEPLLRGHDVATAFSIRRSVNRNRVDYGVRVSAACRADGAEPVFPYWRMLETDGGVEPLLLREEPAYGVASQTVRAGSQGRVVDVQLRAVSDRQVTVRLEQRGAQCSGRGVMRIAGVDARVSDIFVAMASALRVDRVELRGVALDGGRRVDETLRP